MRRRIFWQLLLRRKKEQANHDVICETNHLGLSMVTAFISTSPGLTCPGLLAPDRRDAGSRRVGSRVHGRSEDRGYVVPQASDVSVAGDARWGSRPMAEHRVMSEDLLGVTHYRSRRCYDPHPNCQKLNGTRSPRAAPPYIQYDTEIQYVTKPDKYFGQIHPSGFAGLDSSFQDFL